MKNNYLQDLFSLEGKVALVTGGGRGIGQVICRELARCGADIAIFSRSGAGETVKLIESEGGKQRSRGSRRPCESSWMSWRNGCRSCICAPTGWPPACSGRKTAADC